MSYLITDGRKSKQQSTADLTPFFTADLTPFFNMISRKKEGSNVSTKMTKSIYMKTKETE